MSEQKKGDFLRKASALLFPICWPEPFGLVMIEAMACGTPVLAFDHGSVREVVDDGITGRVVTNFEEAVRELPHVMQLDRGKVRRRFEKRFSARRMAQDYVQIYQKQLSQSLTERRRRPDHAETARLNGDGLLADTGLHVD